MKDFANLIVRDEGRVRIISINRPGCSNAVDGETANELYTAFLNFDQDEAVDVAIFTGEDGTFCAGADLKAFAADESRNPLETGPLNSIGPMGPTRLQLNKPVIAAIEGHAVAGGMEMALWCDLRVMADNAIMGIFCRRFGVPLIDMGTVRLPRLIGQSRAMDLILTGRPVDADEAERTGLANRIAQPGKSLEVALELANTIIGFPQNCMRNDRRSVLEQWGLGHEAAMQNEFEIGLTTIQSGETLSGASAFSSGKGRHGDFNG